MKPGRLMLVGYLWFLLLGCGLFRGDPEPETPPVDYEGCSDDHETRWIAAEDAELRVGETPADKTCNELAFHSGGGFQGGGDVFHFEPTLHLTTTPPESYPDAVTYEITAMDGRVINTQGFELFPDSSELSNDFTHQLFINSEDRGKNVIVRALVTFDGIAGEREVEVKAAYYLNEPAE